MAITSSYPSRDIRITFLLIAPGCVLLCYFDQRIDRGVYARVANHGVQRADWRQRGDGKLMLSTAIEWVLHLDKYLAALAANHSVLVYVSYSA
jgi:GNAT superfamily N-acetyltransferase